MKCPHCNVYYHQKITRLGICNDSSYKWVIGYEVCPSCSTAIIAIEGYPSFERHIIEGEFVEQLESNARITVLANPKFPIRTTLPPEVPGDVKSDYEEASSVLTISPKASAALSRRCLQHILRDYANVSGSGGSLVNEINKAKDPAILPPRIYQKLDNIRNIGNFAAHPKKDTNTGEILEVEPGEAEYCLDVLDLLIEHYFIDPVRHAEMDARVQAKIDAAKKPPIEPV